MSVVFQCPHCGVERTAARFIQGRRLRCPQCNTLVEVPVVEYLGHETVEDLSLQGNELEMLAEPTPPPLAKILTTTLSSPEPEDDEAVGGPAALRRKHKMVEAEMDMTPMVDVTFLLLIFFMVTASFTLQKSLQVPKPEAQDESAAARSFQQLEENPDYITVHVEALGTFRVVTADWDHEAYSEPQLLRELRTARRGLSGGSIPTHLLVRADGEAAHEKVVAAIDAGTAVGMEDIQLLTVEPEETVEQ